MQGLYEHPLQRAQGETESTEAMSKPEITRYGGIDMQVCVPSTWSDEEVMAFAERENPCGTTNGWQIRTNEKWLAGCPVRNPCAKHSGFVHVTLDA